MTNYLRIMYCKSKRQPAMQVSFQVNGQSRSAEVDLKESGARSIVPAVANALNDLAGVRLRHLPLNAERVLEALG